jgi:hypothetical protein
MDARERARLIDRYVSGTEEFRRTAEAIDPADLDRRAGPDEWSPREVIHHFADSEMRAAIRVRQLLAEDAPLIQGYDEKTYTRVLHYDRPVATSIAAATAVRNATTELLGLLAPEDWERSGTHTESGPYSVEDWLRIYADHPYDHAEQIRNALASG